MTRGQAREILSDMLAIPAMAAEAEKILIRIVPMLRCAECGYEISEADWGERCAREARFDGEVVSIDEERTCPECGAREALEEVE